MSVHPFFPIVPSSLVPGKDSIFVNNRGQHLFTRSWQPPPPDDDSIPPLPIGVVMFCHGYDHRVTHDEQWDMIADRLCRAGYACHGIDNIGFGLSPGKRAHIPSYDYIIDDNLAYRRYLGEYYDSVLKAARQKASNKEGEEIGVPSSLHVHGAAESDSKAAVGDGMDLSPQSASSRDAPVPDRLPFFVLGSSMGGATACLIAGDGSVHFDGVMLIAPMCGFDPELMPPKVVVKAIYCMNNCCPTAPLIPNDSDLLIQLSYKDKGKVHRSLKDPGRYIGKLRLQTGISMKTATEMMVERVKDFTFPVLIFHGLADKVTNPATSRKLFDDCASTDKTYVTFAGAWHSLWFEPPETVDLLFEDMLGWMALRGLKKTGPITACNIIHHDESTMSTGVDGGATDNPTK